jgi:hypothetical protein
VSAISQPTPPGETSNPDVINQSGFLAGFLLAPELDTDGDGLADENDRDDDADGLDDGVELAGSSFDPRTSTDPLTADSDGDGANDAQEAGAGTDPLDPSRLFRIVDVAMEGGVARISWEARDGRTYEVLAAPNVELLREASVVDTVSASGGAPPWYSTTAVATNLLTGARVHYLVRVKP